AELSPFSLDALVGAPQLLLDAAQFRGVLRTKLLDLRIAPFSCCKRNAGSEAGLVFVRRAPQAKRCTTPQLERLTTVEMAVDLLRPALVARCVQQGGVRFFKCGSFSSRARQCFAPVTRVACDAWPIQLTGLVHRHDVGVCLPDIHVRLTVHEMKP